MIDPLPFWEYLTQDEWDAMLAPERAKIVFWVEQLRASVAEQVAWDALHD